MGSFSENHCQVINHQQIAPGYFLLRVKAPVVAEVARPGQFAMIGCGSGYDPFLRRPLSIHQVDRERGVVIFLYQVKGEGTRLLSGLQTGDQVSLLGPLGHGFTWQSYDGNSKRGLLVGAGVGVAPLLFLAEELAASGWIVETLLGARTSTGILRPGEFARFGQVRVISDDGSAGRNGTILDLLKARIAAESWQTVFACGPRPVLKGVQQLCQETRIAAQLSLEERMACGVGACLGCTCKGAHDRGYLRVCQEGPVFNAGDVELDS